MVSRNRIVYLYTFNFDVTNTNKRVTEFTLPNFFTSDKLMEIILPSFQMQILKYPLFYI